MWQIKNRIYTVICYSAKRMYILTKNHDIYKGSYRPLLNIQNDQYVSKEERKIHLLYLQSTPFSSNVTYRLSLIIGTVLTWSTHRMSHEEQNLLIFRSSSREPAITLRFCFGSVCPVFIYQCCVFYSYVCLLVFFRFCRYR